MNGDLGNDGNRERDDGKNDGDGKGRGGNPGRSIGSFVFTPNKKGNFSYKVRRVGGDDEKDGSKKGNGEGEVVVEGMLAVKQPYVIIEVFSPYFSYFFFSFFFFLAFVNFSYQFCVRLLLLEWKGKKPMFLFEFLRKKEEKVFFFFPSFFSSSFY